MQWKSIVQRADQTIIKRKKLGKKTPLIESMYYIDINLQKTKERY